MIAEMKKIQVAAPTSVHDDLLQFLQEEEVIHLIESDKKDTDALDDKESTSYRIAELQFALEFLGRVRSELHIQQKKSFRDMFSGKPAAELSELEEVAGRLQLDTLLKDIHSMSDTLHASVTRLEELKARLAMIAPWQNLHIREDHMHVQENIRHILLTIVTRKEDVRAMIAKIPTAEWQEVGRVIEKNATTLYGEMVIHTKDNEMLERFIEQSSADVFDLQLTDNESIQDHIRVLRDDIEKAHMSYKGILKTARKLLKKERDLQFAYDALLHRQEREQAASHMVHLPHITLLTGWIPASCIVKLTKRLEQRFPSVAIEVIAPLKNEVPPVTFRNKAIVKPFESVTNIYGKPAYHELDPSGPLALFFLVSFGLALTDAGYGLVMMALTFAAEKFFRLKHEMRSMIRLLFYAGFATTIIGALTGGWFGITLDALPDTQLKSILLSIRLIDPIPDLMTLLGIAFIVGIIQLLFAWMVRGWHHWNTGKKREILLDDIPWITIIIFILAWAAAQQGMLASSLINPLKWIAIANALFLVATQGRSQKNIFLKFGSGVLSLYGLVNFLSDTLSYSRLLALGLATGIIGLVVNMIAGMVYESIPVAGFVLAGVVLLVGHTFNLGINVLGAFIHAGRLQFVEFFPKFMEGGGASYKPFGRVGKYVDNPKEFLNN